MLSDALLVGLDPNNAAIPERPGRVGEDLDRRQDVVQHDGLPTTPLFFLGDMHSPFLIASSGALDFCLQRI